MVNFIFNGISSDSCDYVSDEKLKFIKKEVKIMLDVITANEIVNALQRKGHNIEWVKDHYLKNFITMDSYVNVFICNVDYWVMPIINI